MHIFLSFFLPALVSTCAATLPGQLPVSNREETKKVMLFPSPPAKRDPRSTLLLVE